MLGAGDVRVHLPPGVYRGIYSAPPAPSTESVSTSSAGAAAEVRRHSSGGSSSHAVDTADVASGLAAARRRFHQLRDMRRELSGRPLASAEVEGGAASPAAAAGNPGDAAAHASVFLTGTPSAASLGLPLNRLAADDPVTRYVLRTAAAERALRQQQRENDELKRTIVAQRGEAALQQALVDRLSADLAESGRTVLRQTATMKSLASEMERRDAYHLIKEKRRASIAGDNHNEGDGVTGAPAPSTEEAAQQRVAALIEQVEQLTRDKAEVTAQLAELSARAGATRRGSAVEAIDTDDEDAMGATGWVPTARAELQHLVQRLGGLLRGGAAAAFGSASRAAAADVVYEVELSGVTCLLPQLTSSSSSGSAPDPTSAAVCVCGPYSRDTVLLCVRPDGAVAVPPLCLRHSGAATAAEWTGRTWCALHAVQQTAGVLCVSLYRGVGVPEAETRDHDNAVDSTQVKPAATATLAVGTLIATALSGRRRDLDATHASSTVHTVHLLSDHGTAHGSVTFHVRVAEVHPLRYRLGRDIGHVEELRRSGENVSCRTQTPQCEARVSTRPSEADCRRTAVLSPARDDAGTPVHSRRPSTPASRRASAAYAPTAETALPQPATVREDDDAALAVPPPSHPSEVASLPPLCTASPLARSSSPPPPAVRKASGEDGEGEVRGLAMAPEHRGGSASDETVASSAALPPLGVAIPPPPRAAVPSLPAFFPPPPPVAVVPAPPPRPATPAACASPPLPTEVRVHVKAIRDVGEGGAGEEDDGGVVEGLLEHCSQLQVVARIGDECVFASPPRRNPAHSVWGAEEGSFTVPVSPGQELRFEVRDGDAPLSEAVVVVLAGDGAGVFGERDVPLLSVRHAAPSGVLSLSLIKPA